MNLLNLLGRRLVRLVIIALLVCFGAMILVNLIPGDVAHEVAGPAAPPSQVRVLNERMGIDRPLLEQYISFLGDLLHGDLGKSLVTDQPVWDSLKERIPVTLELAIVAILLSTALAIPMGVYAAYHADKAFDRATTALASVLFSTPSFVLALLLSYFIALKWRLLPVVGWTHLTDDVGDNLRHVALPALTIALVEAPVFIRLVRNDMVLTLREDYVLAARARGLSPSRVLFRHALRPSSFTLLTVLGVHFARTLGGTVITESVFALPGVGTLATRAITSHDITVVRGVVLFVAILYVTVNALIDLAYPLLDPRIRAR